MAAPLLGGYTLLMVACEERDLPRVQSLLSSHDVNACSDSGSTALTLAVRANDLEIARVLLQSGAEVDWLNKAKQSPLFVACWGGSVEMVAMLLEAGADTNTPDSRGWTPLMAAVHEDNLAIAQLLLRYGCQTAVRDSVYFTQFGKSAFDRAKSPQMTELLQKFASEHKRVPAAENVRRGSDKPEVTRYFEEERSVVRSRTLSMDSTPQPSEKSFANIPASLSPGGKRKQFREALEQEVRKSAVFISKKIEAEYSASLQSGLKQKLREIDGGLRDDLQESLRRSKVAVRNSLKDFVVALVTARLQGQAPDSRSDQKGESLDSTRQDINAREDCPLPYFSAARGKVHSKAESFTQKTKVASALQKFLQDT